MLTNPTPEGIHVAIRAAFAEGDAIWDQMEKWKAWRLKQRPRSAEYTLALKMRTVLEDRARRAYAAAMELVNIALADDDAYIPTIEYLVKER